MLGKEILSLYDDKLYKHITYSHNLYSRQQSLVSAGHNLVPSSHRNISYCRQHDNNSDPYSCPYTVPPLWWSGSSLLWLLG